MKKLINYVAVFVAALSLSLAACSTEDPAEPKSLNMAEGKTATISGTLLVNSDITKPLVDQKYSAVRDVKIIVTVPYKDIFSDSSKGSWSTTVTTDSKGEFKVTVPASEDGVDVSFTASDIKGSQRQFVGLDPKSIDGIWKFTISKESAKSGQAIIKEHTTGTFKAQKEDGSSI